MNKHERLYDIDWLRIFAVVTVFFSHSARFFDYDAWHVKNNELNLGLAMFVAFTVQWAMPLFFVLSGQSAYFSLRVRKGRRYIHERFYRLIIPFLFGVFVLSPPQIYFERVNAGQFTGSFTQFYPHYFEGLYGFGGNFALTGLHLWYLIFLFIFSLLTLPLFLYLRKKTYHHSVSRMVAFLKKPGTIFFLAIPIVFATALTDLVFQPGGLLGQWSGFVYFGGWSLLVYIIFFVYGYVLASNEFRQTIRRHGRIGLVVGLLLSVPVFLQLTSGNSLFFDQSSWYPFAYVLSGFYSWIWVLAILGLGSVYLNFSTGWLSDANEAVLPFYVLNQPVILTVGFYFVSLSLGVFAKYFLIAAASMVVTIFLLMVIRRMNLLRFLFGLRLKERTGKSA